MNIIISIKCASNGRIAKNIFLMKNEEDGIWGGTDIVPENISSEKGSIWKGNYHTSRALINCINRLTGAGENQNNIRK